MAKNKKAKKTGQNENSDTMSSSSKKQNEPKKDLKMKKQITSHQKKDVQPDDLKFADAFDENLEAVKGLEEGTPEQDFLLKELGITQDNDNELFNILSMLKKQMPFYISYSI